jgi:hypothetical protein
MFTQCQEAVACLFIKQPRQQQISQQRIEPAALMPTPASDRARLSPGSGCRSTLLRRHLRIPIVIGRSNREALPAASIDYVGLENHGIIAELPPNLIQGLLDS